MLKIYNQSEFLKIRIGSSSQKDKFAWFIKKLILGQV